MKTFSVIIGYMRSDFKRFLNVNCVIQQWIDAHTDMFDIIVVEQGVQQTLNESQYPGIRYKFIYNPGKFNRSWGFNVGAKMSESEMLVFSDADILIRVGDFLNCINVVINNADTVDPKGRLYNVDLENYGDDRFSLIWDDKSDLRSDLNFSGGMVIMRSGLFYSIGGWDEGFEGWGGEDNAMSEKLNHIEALKVHITDVDMIHLKHDVDKKKKFRPEYKENVKLLNSITEEIKKDKNAFFSRMLDMKDAIGDQYKYSNIAQERHHDETCDSNKIDK